MIRILIADDHKLFLEGISLMISNEPNIEVVGTALNGKEILGSIPLLKPDLILMDINMPLMDGIEATSKIKQNYPKVKILMVTMHNKMRMIQQLMDLGVDGYVLKNVDKKELLEAISTIANGNLHFSRAVTNKLIACMKSKERQLFQLTNREKQVLSLIIDGLSTSEIATRLFLSTHTINTHRKNLLSKVNCKNAAQLINWARENEFHFFSEGV